MDLFVASTGLRLCERAPKSTVHGSQTSDQAHLPPLWCANAARPRDALVSRAFQMFSYSNAEIAATLIWSSGPIPKMPRPDLQSARHRNCPINADQNKEDRTGRFENRVQKGGTPVQKVWTLLALLFIATIFYRVAYVVPYDTCNDIWRQAERRQTDPDRTDFVAQCMHALENSDLFDAAYWKARAQRP